MEPGSQTRTRLLLAITLLLTTYVSWCAADTVYWTGEGGDGLWNTAANWREGDGNGDFDAAGTQRLPESGDTANIDDGDANTTTTVLYSHSDSTDLDGLELAETVRITAGSIDFGNNASVGDAGGLLEIAGGSVGFDNGGSALIDITMTAGELSGANTVTFSGALTLQGGTASLDNGAILSGSVVLQGASLDLANGTELSGTMTVESGDLSLANGADVTGSIVIEGGNVSLDNNGAVSNFSVSDGSLTLTNNADVGEFTMTGGDVVLGDGASVTSLSITGGSIAFEGTATLTDVSVDGGAVEFQDDTVVSGSMSVTAGSVTIPSGASLDAASLSISGGSFSVADGAELEAASMSVSGGVVSIEGTGTFGSLSITGGTISGDGFPATPQVDLSVDTSTLAEAGGAVTVTVDLTDEGGPALASDSDITIVFSVAGTATKGADYSIAGTNYVDGTLTLTIAGGQNTTSDSVTITGVADTLYEGAEGITIATESISNALSGTTTSQTLSVTDDDSAPTITFDAATSSAAEGDGTLTVGVTLSAASGLDATMPYTVSGTATGSNTDHDLADATLTISAGATTGSISFALTDDSQAEGDETVIVTMTTGSLGNATAGATTEHTLTIADDDAPPTVTFSAASQSAAESVGSVTVTADLSSASGSDVTVPYTVTGTATGSGTDHDLADGSLTISAGATTADITINVTADALDEDDETVIVTMTTGSLVNATAGATTEHTATITDDDDGPTVALSAAAQSVAESVGAATVSVALSAASGLDVTVPYTVAGTATGSSTDRDLADGSLTISAGATSADITVNVTADALDEDDETVIVTMTTGSLTNATAGATTAHTLTITDDDSAPAVTFSASAQSAAESAGAVTVSVDLDAASGLDVTMPYTVSGTSTGGSTDHDLADGSLTITAGSSSGTLTVNVTDDTLLEDDETVIVTMTTGSLTNATAGATTTHTVTITDNDSAPSVTFDAATSTAAEGDGTVTIAVTLDAASGLDATIPYTVTGTATGSSTDHDLADGSLTITAGSTTATVSVAVTDDALDEADETIIVTMTTGSLTNASAGATTEHTVTITDDDDAPTVTFSASAQDAAEAVGSVTATVDLSAVSGLDVTVPYTVSGAATGSGTDHDLADGSLTISAGASSGDITFTVTADTMDEPDESAIVSITTGSLVNATQGATTTHTVTVVDDDDPPTVAFGAASQSAAESVGTVSLSVLLAAESGWDVSVPYTVTGTATGSGTDHDLADGTLTISAGSTAEVIGFTVTDDALDELDETVLVSMTTGSLVNASAGAVTTHTATIADDDDAASVTFDAATSTAAESDGTITIGVSLSATSTFDVTMPYTISGTATGSNTDHDLADGSLTISAGATTGSLSVALTADALDESDETIIVSMTTGSLTNASAGAVTAHTLTITDDDDTPTVTFDAASATAAESDGAVTIGVTLSAASGLDVSMPYTLSGTATDSGTDHDLADSSLTISAGATTANLTLTVVGDALNEGDETAVVSMTTGSLSNASAGATTVYTLTITDDDTAPTVTFDSASSTATESAGSVSVAVSLSAASGLDVTVPYTVSGTATDSGTDHDLADGSLTILAGATTGSVDISITMDSLHEGDETVIVTMSTGSLTNASAGATTEHTVTITDNDAAPTVAFDASSSTAAESAGAVTIDVSLSAASGLDVTVPYTVSGTATGSGTDHDLADGSLTISAGATSGSVSLTVSDDALDEDDETVVVTMTTGSLVNASAGATTEHTLTLTDNDAAPTVTFDASSSTVAESDGTVTIAVSLSAASGLDATVPYTVGGTATVSTDHDLADGSLTISAGSTTATLSIAVTDDAVDEADETVVVTMTTASLVNASAGVVTAHTMTVTDDDTASVAFSAATQTAVESAGTVSVAVALSIESAFDVTVPYTVSGTATGSGTDHDLADGSLTISAGSMTEDIVFSATTDSLHEADETVVVSMITGSLVNASAGATTTHTVTITDDDSAPTVTFDASASTSAEAAGAITIGVSLSAASGLDVTIPYTVAGTAEAAGVDHDLADGSLTLSAGATTGSLSLTLTDDALDEDDETVIVSITTGSLVNSTAGATTAHTVTVTDDDALPTVTFDASTSTVAESDGAVDIDVTLSAVSGRDVTVPYTVSGTADGSGTDHDLASGSLTVSAGATTGALTVTVSDDAIDESDETVIVSMTTGSLVNADAGAVTAHTMTITDNDDASVAFDVSSQTVGEADGTLTITVALDIESAFDVTVPYTIAGSATGGSVDHDLADGSLTVSAGATTADITASLIADSLDEDDETIVVTMTTGSLVNATAGVVTTHTTTISDDDALPTVAFSSATQTVGEGDGTITVDLELSAASGRDVTAPFTVAGTASGGSVDHSLAASSVVFSAGDTSASTSFSVVDDTTEEGDETVIVTLDGGSFVNATEGVQGSHTVTVEDNDSPPAATAQSVTTVEDTAVSITLAGTDTDGDTLTYTVTTDPTNGTLTGTAPDVTFTPTADYAGSDTFEFTVNDGQTDSAAATVTVTVSEDNDAPTFTAIADQTVGEDLGAVTITLSGIDAGGGGDEDSQSLTVTAVSDATGVVPDPTIGGSPFTEGGSDPTLTFTPVADATGSATITVTALDDGATDSVSDPKSGTTTFTVTVVSVTEASLTISSGGESHVVSFGFSASASDDVDTAFADIASAGGGSVIDAAFSRSGSDLERDILATPTGDSLAWSLVVDELTGADADVTISWTQADVDALLSAAGSFNNALLVASSGGTRSLSAANNGFSTTVLASDSETWTLMVDRTSVRTGVPVDISLTADTWHLLSLPGAGDLSALEAVNLSAFTWNAASEVYEAVTDLSAVSSVSTGIFLFSDQTTTVSLELDVDIASARESSVTLSPGWNLVGAPATQNDTESWGVTPASLLTGGALNRVFSFDSAGAYAAVTSLDEGDGYWALNPDSTDSAVTLTQARHLSGETSEFYPAPDVETPKWTTTLALAGADKLARSVTLGLSEEAAVGYDAMDMPQPPAPIQASATALYIATDDVVARLTQSVQPADGDGAEWRIVVNAPDAGVLRWVGSPPPPGYRISLSAYGGEWDLAERGHARVPAGRQELVARLVRDIPGATALLPNFPNPFNPETWIPFELNEDSRVRIEIYATTGELVRAIDLGHRVAGRHVTRENAAHWDGRNMLGEAAASGTYMYVLRAGGESRYGRMVVLK